MRKAWEWIVSRFFSRDLGGDDGFVGTDGTSELLVSLAAIAYWPAARLCSPTAAVGSIELTVTACRAWL